MPRPRKYRHVHGMPERHSFGPLGDDRTDHTVTVMTVDEYETIRLIDLERLSQEECAEKMQVARTTVQAIYGSARIKLAEFLVNGTRLVIEGGHYILAGDKMHGHGHGIGRLHGRGTGQACCSKKKCHRHELQDEKSIGEKDESSSNV